MDRNRYTKEFRLMVVQEALKPEYDNMEEAVAIKYGIKPNTLVRWKTIFLEEGECGLSKYRQRARRIKLLEMEQLSERTKDLEKENAALKEEVAILKKAAAFLADLRRE